MESNFGLFMNGEHIGSLAKKVKPLKGLPLNGLMRPISICVLYDSILGMYMY